MAIFTFTTDLGTSDYFVAALKGRLLSALPSANIVDVNNSVPKFDHLKAAFIVKNAYQFFPKNTVHIIGVNNYKNNINKVLIAHYKEHYFVCFDNGFFSLLNDENQEIKLYEFEEKKVFTNNLSPFESLVDAAIAIGLNKNLPALYSMVKEYKKQFVFKPILNEKSIQANVIYIDSFENVITNVTMEIFANYTHYKKLAIKVHPLRHEIKSLSKSYDEVEAGNLLAIFNYTGYLEIAMNQANAAKLLGLKVGDKIFIEFN